MTDWYMLRLTDVSRARIIGNPALTAREPRAIPVTRCTSQVSPVDLLDGDSALCLIGVEPSGTVCLNQDDEFFCPRGWMVAGPEPAQLLLGPQHQHLQALHESAQEIPDDLFVKYTEIVSGIQADTELRRSWNNASRAALAALELQGGADGQWWQQIDSHPYGPVLLAVAARDLTGPDPRHGWSRAAYELLTGPWTAAFGLPPHPEDRPMTEEADHGQH